MSRLVPLRRILLRSAIVLLVLVVLALGAVRFYLRSGSAARLVQEQIHLLLGAPVELDGVNIPFWGQASVSHLRLFEPDGQPLLEADRAAADLSVLGYLRGRTKPRTIDLVGVHVRLRFDANGGLLTKLPVMKSDGAPTPAVRIRDGSLTLDQQGRAPFTLHGGSLTLQPTGRKNLFGIIDDPVWGALDVAGRVDPNGPFSITLDSKAVALTADMLRSLPFVPPSLWSTIEIDGPRVGLTFTLAIASHAPLVRYTVAFDRARVTLPQPDRKALVASPASGVLHGNENGFTLESDIRDPYWGEWTVNAGMVGATGAIQLDLQTREANVDPQKLAALPYVPKSVWDQVQAAGRTPVHVQVGLFTNKPGVHYRVELAMNETTVFLPAIDLRATHAAGAVVIEDSRVLLRQVTGRTAGGVISTTGDLDFRQDPTQLQFAVTVRDVTLKELPKKWEVPPQVEGKVTGDANMTVTIHDGVAQTHGTGKGRIEQAKLIGFPTREPIELTLTADGRTFRFLPRSPLLNVLLLTSVMPPPQPPPIAAPAQLVGQAVSGVGNLAQRIALGASTVLMHAGPAAPPKPAGEAPTYLDANVKLDDADLAELIQRLGLQLPVKLAGRLSFQVKLGIPLNTAADLQTYRLNGSASLSSLVVGGVEINRLRADVQYAKGLLELQKLSAEVTAGPGKGGVVEGRARVQLFPRGDLSVDLNVRDLPVDRLAQAVPALAGKASGVLSGTVRGGVPLDRAGDLSLWRGAASLRIPTLDVYGLTFRNVSANATVLRGAVALSGVSGELYGSPLTGSGSLSLSGPQPFQGEVKVSGLDVARLGTLLPADWSALAARGGVGASAEVRGTLQPFTISGSGKLLAAGIHVAGVPIDKLAVAATVGDGKLKVSQFDAEIAKGKMTGTADVPLVALGAPATRENDPKTKGQVAVRISDVDLYVLAGVYKDLPFRVSGQASGALTGTYTPDDKGGKPGTWAGEIDVTAPTLKLQDIPARKLHGRLEYRDGKADYRLDGETLGGKLSIEGKLPPPPRSSADRTDGRLRLENARLSQLWGPLGLRDSLGPLRGLVSVDLPYRHEGPSLTPVGRGRFEVRTLRWQRGEVAESIRGDLRLTGEGLSLRDLAADLAGGQLRFALSYNWRHTARSWFTINLSQAEASRLLVFDPAAQDVVQGPVDVNVRGSLGRAEWRAAGSLEMARGKVMGVEVTELHLPFDLTFVPRRGRGELAVHESHAQMGQGRAQMQASMTWGESMRLEGNLRLLEASLGSLGGMLGSVSHYARGRVTGKVDFGGGEVRSIGDVTATADAKLKDAQALQLPILNLAVPFLPGQGALTFRDGDFKARLAGGVWRIQQMTLTSSVAQLLVQGTLSVRNGGLDLDVITRTSALGGLNPLLTQGFLAQIPAIGPIPVGLIIQATQLLANRVFRLHISGTTKSPHITVEPIRLLSEEAVRFFLLRSL